MKKSYFQSVFIAILLLSSQVNFAQTLGEKDLVEKIRHAVFADSFKILQTDFQKEAQNQLTQSNPLSELGLELITKERFEEAEAIFEINSQIFPEAEKLGNVLLKLAEQNPAEIAEGLTASRKSYEEAIPNTNYLNTLGKHFLRFGKSEKARNIFQLNTLLFPKSAEVWETYAKSLLACQDCEKASFYYKKVLEMPIPNELEQEIRQQVATIDRLLASKTINNERVSTSGRVDLFGKINQQAFEISNYKKWFAPKYDAYEVDEFALSSLKNSISSDISFKVFFGSWCGDSQRELPRFLKVTNQLDLTKNQLKIFATDNSTERYKQSANREEKGLAVYRVPTFIVYKKGKEIGRIIEFPKESMEQDLVKIIGGDDYTPNYAGVMEFEAILQKKGEKYISRNQAKLAKQFKELTKKGSELSSYAMTKFANGESELAINILEINAMIYPDYAYNQYRLAKIQQGIGNKKEAIALWNGFLAKNPNVVSARMMLREIDN